MSLCLTILFLGLMSALITHADTENYSFVAKWDSSGSGGGDFYILNHMFVDHSDNIYVATIGSNRIQEFDNNGKLINQWGSDHPPSGAVNSSGYIYVDSGPKSSDFCIS
jgi:tripartite motif-containing protein 71